MKTPNRRTRRAADAGAQSDAPAAPVNGQPMPPGTLDSLPNTPTDAGSVIAKEVNDRVANGEDMTTVLKEISERTSKSLGPHLHVTFHVVKSDGSTGYGDVAIKDMKTLETAEQIAKIKAAIMQSGQNIAIVTILNIFELKG